ncbi:DUF1905 domain-containing protein [uncultured Psychroserpens sp.]|uniref:DUF1905 domain-containing protein n=1 Tax=uncultured Psychroserpens sp. TaxID=255436 RepID=UPI00262EEF68|nr:DUF1905 domain-containing protein [uncultured Psychroserpens sp.]
MEFIQIEKLARILESKIKYQFSGKLWRDNSDNGWYFITVPDHFSKEIRSNLQWQEEGWGRMKATAVIEDLNWNTSIWFDTKAKNYILPVKSEIRKKLSLQENDLLSISILV